MTEFNGHGSAENTHPEWKYTPLLNRHIPAGAFTVDYGQRYSRVLFQGIPKSPFSEVDLIIGKSRHQFL
jgi:hypothetical protein